MYDAVIDNDIEIETNLSKYSCNVIMMSAILKTTSPDFVKIPDLDVVDGIVDPHYKRMLSIIIHAIEQEIITNALYWKQTISSV